MSRARSPRLMGLVGLAALAMAASIVVACGDKGLDPTEASQLFGDDRVGDELRASLAGAPRTYGEFETRFGIGRQCPREDSAEIYVIEEPMTRIGGTQHPTAQMVPRAAVTGCSPHGPADEDERRASLMVALVSRLDGDPGASEGDYLATDVVEAMAKDRSTGVYNFYVLHRATDGDGPYVQRLVEGPDGSVLEITKDGDRPLTTKPAETPRCFACHTSGAPVMNELSDPWTSWLSVRKTKLANPNVVGETANILGVAREGVVRRPSSASSLEVTVRAGLRSLVLGREGNGPAASSAAVDAGSTAAAPTKGLGAALEAGRAAGGWSRLVRAVLCETSLQYLSATDTVPVELFVDPGGLSDAPLLRPEGAGDGFPRLLPVRSLLDGLLETYLVERGYLSPDVVRAARLVDEENDVFSAVRCGLYDAVLAAAPQPGPELDGALRTELRNALARGVYGDGPRRAYAEVLLDPARSAERIPARDAYAADVRARVDAAAAALRRGDNRPALEARVEARRARARVLFPGDANPLPHFGPMAP